MCYDGNLTAFRQLKLLPTCRDNPAAGRIEHDKKCRAFVEYDDGFQSYIGISRDHRDLNRGIFRCGQV